MLTSGATLVRKATHVTASTPPPLEVEARWLAAAAAAKAAASLLPNPAQDLDRAVLALAGVVLLDEFHLGPMPERVAILDRRKVAEDVLASIVRLDEAKAALAPPERLSRLHPAATTTTRSRSVPTPIVTYWTVPTPIVTAVVAVARARTITAVVIAVVPARKVSTVHRVHPDCDRASPRRERTSARDFRASCATPLRASRRRGGASALARAEQRRTRASRRL